MFESSDTPRLFGVAPGVDFPANVADGLKERLADTPPHAMAKVELFVNTTRMRRRIVALFQQGGACFLPKIRLITDLANDPTARITAEPVDPLRRRLELARLVKRLIEKAPDLAAEDSAYDLADSLATLMDEMQGEGVSFDVLKSLDVEQHSAHWARSLTFLEIVGDLLSDTTAMDTEERQRVVVEEKIAEWEVRAPNHPIIIAGSTGSRGTTNLLMQAVSRLPKGAVILPGYDFDLPSAIWDRLMAPAPGTLSLEDHPQFRFAALLKSLGLQNRDVPAWHDHKPHSPARNQLISLALRPAPVTDSWLTDGKKLTELPNATSNLSLIEAKTPRAEAVTIALRLRQAVEDNQLAAVITSDRTLTRQITAALQRWGIVPDDSGGIPLAQTAPGRLLRQTADIMMRPLTSETFLALLKHPLVSRVDRSTHLLRTRDLELQAIRGKMAFPNRAAVLKWAEQRRDDPDATRWVDSVFNCIDALHVAQTTPMTDLASRHIQVTEELTRDAEETPALWGKASGETARDVMQSLRDAADAAGDMTATDYTQILGRVLSGAEARDPVNFHPGVMIWGTLEARVQGADLVILAGLNDGVWPETPPPDPWLNRQMRQNAGLLLPERRIGLSAHDFQQAVAAKEVWLTRSVRDAEAETVPSRWINRLCNLLEGIPGGDEMTGAEALQHMRGRGNDWLAKAAELERPKTTIPPARRPAPRPPVAVRPTKLSVTRIETLIRDPYAIYAQRILKLRALDPLSLSPDAPLRGQAIHTVLQEFVSETRDDLSKLNVDTLMNTADRVFSETVPWPATRAMWRAHLSRVAHWFLTTEAERQQEARPTRFEEDGRFYIDEIAFELHGRADRIDLDPLGAAYIYDYKTGSVPSNKQMEHFNKQVPLLALIATKGGFPGLPPHVARAGYIGLGAKPDERIFDVDSDELDSARTGLVRLIAAYQTRSQGYASRRAMETVSFSNDFDTLARFGEWDVTDPPAPVDVGP
ncbi:double-strand break repair protein AddB [Litoreibacter roseus]|uniref:Double-strand break repair protein AddB n=1 Tax=Litoreibacter roseus TaxID=2601869 RepID=A0A6N6JHS3_9RHOB|nr:double-strand break repair protein AddB [Litoreibacter roseus]GFE64772.1 double-strand break repair protein AddB [Litoreibacter roseus]